MDGKYNFLFGMSVVFPLVIGLVRYKQIRHTYQPFVLYIVISFLTEMMSYFLIRIYHTNLVLLNIFSLLECIVLVVQFHRWGFLKEKKNFFLLLSILFACWTVENFIISDISNINRIFLIAYSFMLVILSIREINRAMILGTLSLYDNARFIICIGIIIYFTFSIITQTFNYFGYDFSKNFINAVFAISVYANLITNIIYAFGMYYIPEETNTGNMFKDKM